MDPKVESEAKHDEIPDAELDKISGGDGNWGSALTVRSVPDTSGFSTTGDTIKK